MVKNWIKYNFINSKNTILCINKELKEIKNTEFVFKFYDICRELNYPLEIIFEGIQEVENNLSEDTNSEIFKQNTSLIEKEEEVEETEETFEENVDFKEVVNTFNNNIHPITPIEYEKLKNWEDDVKCDAIILAIKEAVNHNARTLSYINSILNNWYNLGLYSAQAVNAYQRDWNSKNKKDKNESMANAEAYMYVE
nr:DnaD domain protein [Clostridium ganghwense]